MAPDHSSPRKGAGPLGLASRAFLVAAGVVSLAGCGTVALRHSFNDYSSIYAETQNRQMLLNLARLNEREPIYFFQLAQISAGYTFTGSLGLLDSNSVGLANSATANIRTANGTVGAAATHNPVFTLVPLGGDKFAQQLLAPIKPGIFYELYEEGWPIDLLMRVMIERIELVRDVAGSGPSGANPGANERLEVMINDPLQCKGGHYDRFLRACALARTFQANGILYLDISERFEPLAETGFREAPSDGQLLSADKAGLEWHRVTPDEVGSAPLPVGDWQLGRSVRQTLFKLNEARLGEARADLENAKEFAGNDDLMAKFRLVLRTGIGVTDTDTSKNAYKVRLVMRSLLGAMLAVASEQHNYRYYDEFRDRVSREAIREQIDTVRSEIEAMGSQETMSADLRARLSERQRALSDLIERSVDSVPTFEDHPVLLLERSDARAADPRTTVVALDYKGRHYAIADATGHERPTLDTWNRDVFRLLVQLSLQVSADPSAFALPSLLQSH